MKQISLFIIGLFLFSNIFLTSSTVLAALPQCVDSGQTCVIGGTKCCKATESCTGKFPNTYCQ